MAVGEFDAFLRVGGSTLALFQVAGQQSLGLQGVSRYAIEVLQIGPHCLRLSDLGFYIVQDFVAMEDG